MDTFNILSLLMLAPIGASLILIIKKQSPSVALMLSIAISVLMLTYALSCIDQMIKTINDIVSGVSVDLQIFKPLIKITGIGIVSRIASEICKDAGENGLASKVELCAATASIMVALPLFSMVLNLVRDLL